MSQPVRTLLLVLVIAGVTAAIRFLPFAVFHKKVPKVVLQLGVVMPPAIMGMLIVYCLRNVSLTASPHGLPEGIAIAAVAVAQKVGHNVLLSILGGTVLYMALLQIVF